VRFYQHEVKLQGDGMLKDINLFGNTDKVKIAIERLKTFEPDEGYYLAFSGGKDSVVIKALAEMAGVKYDAHYNLTTIDPPELVQFIKREHPDVIRHRPPVPFLVQLVKNGFPQRQRRWCCRLLKEKGGEGRVVLTGVRSAESNQRSKRKMVEGCRTSPDKRYLHPIIDWSDAEVWQFIRENGLPYCKLYDEGWKRVGCLFCPMAYEKQRLRHATLYPIYTKSYIRAFTKLYDKKIKEGKCETVERWKDGEDMFWWWLRGNSKRTNDDQVSIFD